MLKSEVVAKQRQLKMTSALFVTRLVYQACVNASISSVMYPKLAMGEFCTAGDHEIANQLVPWLTEELHSAGDVGERMAMLTALGNIGHEMILPSILPYVANCEPSTTVEFEWIERNRHLFGSPISAGELRAKWFQHRAKPSSSSSSSSPSFSWQKDEDRADCNLMRTKAVFALTNLAVQKESLVHAILMPIFFNKAEETEVRLAALSLLFVSEPPQAFWNRLASSTWFEPNQQVAHYIYTTIASRVQNKNPIDREVLADDESE